MGVGGIFCAQPSRLQHVVRRASEQAPTTYQLHARDTEKVGLIEPKIVIPLSGTWPEALILILVTTVGAMPFHMDGRWIRGAAPNFLISRRLVGGTLRLWRWTANMD